MKDNKLCIIEIGSNNTKIHVYEEDKLIFEKNKTIEFKRNFLKGNKLNKEDIKELIEFKPLIELSYISYIPYRFREHSARFQSPTSNRIYRDIY